MAGRSVSSFFFFSSPRRISTGYHVACVSNLNKTEEPEDALRKAPGNVDGGQTQDIMLATPLCRTGTSVGRWSRGARAIGRDTLQHSAWIRQIQVQRGSHVIPASEHQRSGRSDDEA